MRLLSMFAGNEEGDAARAWIYSAVGWLVAGPIFGLLVAIQFFIPTFLGGTILSFGRLRPIHVNGVLFGWLTTVMIGLMFYMVPRLTGTRLFSERLGCVSLWLWNVVVFAGLLGILLGMNEGREYAELPWYADIGVVLAVLLVTYNLVMTVKNRKERQLYVSLWYFLGSLFALALIYIVGNRTFVPLSGLNDAIIAWWYGHNILGMWFTTVSVGIMYYVLPVETRNPLYSHKLSMLGFWSLFILYTPTGAHHILQAPIPEWLKITAVVTSVLLLLPVATVLMNFFKTMEGAWETFFSSPAIKFAAVGSIFYLLTCIQGPMQATNIFNYYVHFTQWVLGHAHLALLGAFTFMNMGAVFYVLPRLSKRQIWSKRLITWQFWITLVGFLGFFLSMTMLGLIQAANWLPEANSSIYLTLPLLKNLFIVRALFGGVVIVGFYIFAYNVYKTATAGEPLVVPKAIEVAA